MALASTLLHPVAARAPSERAAPRMGFFRKLLLAMMDARRRQAEIEIARHIGFSDRLTDEIERKMGEQMFGSGRPLL